MAEEIDSIERLWKKFVKFFSLKNKCDLYLLFIYLRFFFLQDYCLTGMDSEFVEEFAYDPGISSRWNI